MAKFKVGDKVKTRMPNGGWSDTVVIERIIESAGKKLYVCRTSNGTYPAHEWDIRLANSRSANAASNASLKKGDAVEYIGPIQSLKGWKGVVDIKNGERVVAKGDDGSMHIAPEKSFKAVNASAANATAPCASRNAVVANAINARARNAHDIDAHGKKLVKGDFVRFVKSMPSQGGVSVAKGDKAIVAYALDTGLIFNLAKGGEVSWDASVTEKISTPF